MFGDILSSLVKTGLSVVSVPVAVVSDVVTMGGAMTDKDKPYTAEALSDLVQNIKDATTPEKK